MRAPSSPSSWPGLTRPSTPRRTHKCEQAEQLVPHLSTQLPYGGRSAATPNVVRRSRGHSGSARHPSSNDKATAMSAKDKAIAKTELTSDATSVSDRGPGETSAAKPVT